MDRSQFRKFLLLYIVLSLTGLAAAFGTTGYSTRLADAFAAEPETWFVQQGWLVITLGLPLTLGGIAGLAGLFCFQSWGRTLSLWTTLLAVPFMVLTGPSLLSSVENALWYAATLAWGALLAIAYLPPVSDLFRAEGEPEPVTTQRAGI